MLSEKSIVKAESIIIAAAKANNLPVTGTLISTLFRMDAQALFFPAHSRPGAEVMAIQLRCRLVFMSRGGPIKPHMASCLPRTHIVMPFLGKTNQRSQKEHR